MEAELSTSGEDGEYVSSSEDVESFKDQLNGFPCYICGRILRKPSLLEQHLRSHSNERPFDCPVCSGTYKSQYHLDRHVKLKHDSQCEAQACSWEGCKFTSKNGDSLKRHMNRHERKGRLQRFRDKSMDVEKPHVCEEADCGKAFKYPSQLRYHEEKHHAQQFIDVICSEPGCRERFDHPSDLSQHMKTAHKYVFCEVCGKVCLRANIKRHYEGHETDKAAKVRIDCPYPECSRTYTEERNLRKHIKTSHLKFRPYKCSHKACELTFAYKHVRDNHEKVAHAPGDFEAEDRKRPKREGKSKGGRPPKRKVETIEDIFVDRPKPKKPSPTPSKASQRKSTKVHPEAPPETDTSPP